MVKSKTHFESCEFVGEGQRDIRDIIKQELVHRVNEEKGYAYMSLKNNDKIIKNRKAII